MNLVLNNATSQIVPGDLINLIIEECFLFESLDSSFTNETYRKGDENNFCLVISVFEHWIYIMTPDSRFGWVLSIFWTQI